MTGWLFASSATTEGSRFRPSSPGITTGVSPCIKATRELVVPRSMPTMRSVAISWLLLLKRRIYISDQIPDVIAAVQHIYHLARCLGSIFGCGVTAIDQGIPGLPVRFAVPAEALR